MTSDERRSHTPRDVPPIKPETPRPSEPLSEKAVQDLLELASILRKIHVRLIAEGYTIEDGRIFKREDTIL